MTAMEEDLSVPELLDASVILIRKREPYTKWAKGVFGDDDGLDDLVADVQAYLVPEVDDIKQLVARKDKWLARVFNNELMAWSQDPDDWPKDRSWRVFKQWFEIELHTMTYDARIDMR